MWHYFTDMFDFLTLSVVINDQIFCVHGGLSPSIHSIDQIKIIDRFREIPHEGPMADLVWSDPDPDRDEFSLSPRGAGYTFGAQVVRKFLEVNAMSHILRAHQLCQEGFQVLYDDRYVIHFHDKRFASPFPCPVASSCNCSTKGGMPQSSPRTRGLIGLFPTTLCPYRVVVLKRGAWMSSLPILVYSHGGAT